jgi:hypothetical protein
MTDTPGPDLAYRNYLAEGAFMIQKCGGCGRHVFYPRVLCPHCASDALDWVRPSGDGTVYATSVVRQRPEKGPHYNVALVELAEGPRVMSRVEGVAPEDVTIGMAVTAEVDRGGDAPLVIFRPKGGGS